MSYNVPESLLRVSKSLTLMMDVSVLTDKQIKNIVKYVTNGALPNGNSATATIARTVIKKYKLAHFKYDNYGVSWFGIPPDVPFFDTIKKYASLAKLDPELKGWYANANDDLIRYGDQKPSEGSASYYCVGDDMKKHVRKEFKIRHTLPTEAQAFLTKLTNREIGTLPLTLYGKNGEELDG